jgi:hypothetical protein
MSAQKLIRGPETFNIYFFIYGCIISPVRKEIAWKRGWQV